MSNKTPSIEVKTRKISSYDVKKMNEIRDRNGAETIVVISTEGFTKKAKGDLEQQGAVCVTLPASSVRNQKQGE
jgi:hypothetical protein